jgi:predicted site-specific integrase-resolvase
LQRQVERLRQYAQERNYHIAAEYTDIASGLNQKRRGLIRVMKAAEQGEFKKLLIEYPDRLARLAIPILNAT